MRACAHEKEGVPALCVHTETPVYTQKNGALTFYSRRRLLVTGERKQTELTVKFMYVALLQLLLLTAVQSTTVDRRSCHSVLYNEGCSYSELTVKRVAYSATVPRQITVYLHAQSSETLLLQVLVLFVDLRSTLHGALLFNPSRAYKYLKVMRESDFQYNNEMWLTSRGRRVMLQYELDENATYLDPLGPYDAALLLGAHSTLWHQYNALITERTQLILRYDDVTTVDNTRQDFAGVYALQCGQDGGHACQVTGSGGPATTGLWVNGRFYAGHRLIVDPTATSNRLPVELYMRWQYHGERVLSVAATEDGPLVMHLNRRFQYEAHSNDSVRDIVVGPDVWHFFQRTERRMETAQLLLYYTRYYNEVDGDDQPFRQFGVCVFVTVLLIGLFQWFTSTDYDILYLMLRQRRGDDARVAFEYKQVMAEVNAVVCCALLWLLTLIFTDPLSAPTSSTATPVSSSANCCSTSSRRRTFSSHCSCWRCRDTRLCAPIVTTPNGANCTWSRRHSTKTTRTSNAGRPS